VSESEKALVRPLRRPQRRTRTDGKPICGSRFFHIGAVGNLPAGVEQPASVAQKPKSDLYRDLLPLLNSRRIELLDHARLLAQLVGLERRTARSGRDSIDHAPGGHDDIANAVAGALVYCSVPKQRIRGITMAAYGVPSIEIKLRGQIEPERTRIRRIKVRESDVPAARGP
jgi:hypothetical protein